MTYPENYRYTKEHEWVTLAGDIATIGITLLLTYALFNLPDLGVDA